MREASRAQGRELRPIIFPIQIPRLTESTTRQAPLKSPPNRVFISEVALPRILSAPNSVTLRSSLCDLCALPLCPLCQISLRSSPIFSDLCETSAFSAPQRYLLLFRSIVGVPAMFNATSALVAPPSRRQARSAA